jgi:hypothetical protein
MSAKYLLPCRCGKNAVVEPRQAGEAIVCSCGATLDVPTMLAIGRLDVAAEEMDQLELRPGWGWPERLLAIGLLSLMLSVAAGAWLAWTRPISRFSLIDPERIRQSAKNLSAAQTWEIWEGMKQGIDRRTDQQYADAVRKHQLWMITAGTVGLIGAGLIAAGATQMRKQPTSAAARYQSGS